MTNVRWLGEGAQPRELSRDTELEAGEELEHDVMSSQNTLATIEPEMDRLEMEGHLLDGQLVSAAESEMDLEIRREDAQCGPTRVKLMRWLNSVTVQLLLLLLIAFDLGLTVYQIGSDLSQQEYHHQPMWVTTVTLVIICVLMVEVGLRVFGLGISRFLTHWSNVLDLAVSVLSLTLEAILLSLHSDNTAAGNLAFVRAVRPIARVSRVCRVTSRAYQQQKNMKAAARHLVGGNKRRYTEHGFALDLVYVTDTLSTPAPPRTARLLRPRRRQHPARPPRPPSHPSLGGIGWRRSHTRASRER